MMILRVNFEMFREVVDALAEERHLYFRRSGVALVGLVLADDSGLAVLGKGHRSSTNGPGTLGSTRPPYSVYLGVRTHAAKSWYRKTYHSKSVQPPGAKIPRAAAACPVPPARHRSGAAGPIQRTWPAARQSDRRA